MIARKDLVRKRALNKVPAGKLELMGLERGNKAPVKKFEDQGEELREIFDQVMGEIEERQAYLEEIGPLDEPKLKERIKKEIIERVSELQKITKMKDQLQTKKG